LVKIGAWLTVSNVFLKGEGHSFFLVKPKKMTLQCCALTHRPTTRGSYDDLSDAAESVELPSLPAVLQLPGREESSVTPLNRSFDATVRRSLSIRGSRGSRSRLVRQASTMETPIDSTGFKMTYWF